MMKKLDIRLVGIALVLATAIGVFAVIATETPSSALAEDGQPEAAPAPAAAAAGAAAIDTAPLWAKHCKSCHGDDGKGDTKAGKMKKVRDLTDAEVRAGFDRDAMIKTLSEGMKDESGKVLMKPYNEKMNAEEIAALADYVLDILNPLNPSD